MPKVIRIDPVSSIKAGPRGTVLPDGTIVKPVPYYAVNVTMDDGTTVQVETDLNYKLTLQMVLDKLDKLPKRTFGEVTEGDLI